MDALQPLDSGRPPRRQSWDWIVVWVMPTAPSRGSVFCRASLGARSAMATSPTALPVSSLVTPAKIQPMGSVTLRRCRNETATSTAERRESGKDAVIRQLGFPGTAAGPSTSSRRYTGSWA